MGWCGAEGIAEKSIVEIVDIAPEAVVTVAAFGNEAMDVGIPFQIPAKGMENQNKTGSEVHGFVLFKKHTGDNTVYSMKEAAGHFIHVLNDRRAWVQCVYHFFIMVFKNIL